MFPNYNQPYGTYAPYSPYARARVPGIFGLALLACGLIAVGAVVAPHAVEQAIPGWRERFGLLIMIGVAFGFMRSVFRLIIPVLTLAFWITAVFCVAKPHINLPFPTQIAHSAPAPREQVPSVVPASFSSGRGRSTALPDSAYFPPQRGSGGFGSGGSSITGAIGKLLGRRI